MAETDDKKTRPAWLTAILALIGVLPGIIGFFSAVLNEGEAKATQAYEILRVQQEYNLKTLEALQRDISLLRDSLLKLGMDHLAEENGYKDAEKPVEAVSVPVKPDRRPASAHRPPRAAAGESDPLEGLLDDVALEGVPDSMEAAEEPAPEPEPAQKTLKLESEQLMQKEQRPALPANL